MKILHLANHCDRVGNGIMNVAVDLACGQAERGHEVVFASGGGSFAPLLEERGVRHIEIRQHWRSPLRVIAGAFRLRRLLQEFNPDIVHAHMMGGALMARALGPAALVTSVHNEWQKTARLMGVADRVIAVSEATRQAMAARGVPIAKLRTVRNGPLGSPRVSPASAAGPALLRPAVLTVCGLYRRKGVSDLIDAFAAVADKHHSARLYIAGDGPDRATFESQAQSSGARDRIMFLGFVSDPAPLFHQTDVFALASRSEPFGLVLAEAREAQCAIIGAATGGIPEVLEHGAAGLLTPPGDVPALAAALDHLLGDAEVRKDYARRAGANLAWLNCSRMVEETLDVYRELLQRHGPWGKAAPAAS